MNYKELVYRFCNSLGLDTVGSTRCRRFEELSDFLKYRQEHELENEFEEKDISKRVDPFVYMPEGKTIISIAFPYSYGNDTEKAIYFSKYTMGTDYHKVVMVYLNQICEYINSIGGKALAFIDSNFLPERYIASLCNIGFIGKNNMLITEKYGSYVFLGEIITDLDLHNEDEACARIISKCGSCDLCIKACPTHTLSGKECNTNMCLSYITQKKHIDEKWFDILGGRIFGCDSCQISCPINKSAQSSNIKEFEPKEYMVNPNIKELINLNNDIFNRKYKITSCGWRGKNTLIRNSLIAAYNNNEKIEDFKSNSSYIQEYNHRLLKKKEL